MHSEKRLLQQVVGGRARAAHPEQKRVEPIGDGAMDLRESGLVALGVPVHREIGRIGLRHGASGRD
jgi:hypothetical protein